jgi:hypothetical protein
MHTLYVGQWWQIEEVLVLPRRFILREIVPERTLEET